VFTPGSHERRHILAIALAAGCISVLSCEMPIDLDEQPPGSTATCIDYGQQLQIASSIPLSSNNHDVEVIDGWVYVASRNLTVIEMDPQGGAAMVKETTVRADRLAASGSTLCATDFDRLLLIDASSAHRGEVLGETSLPFMVRSIAADNSHAYLLTRDRGLWIADISDRSAPQIVGSVDIPAGEYSFDETNAVAVLGNTACAITSTDLWVIDVSDRTSPRRVGHLRMNALYIRALAMIDHYAVLNVDGDIAVIDIRPSQPTVVVTTNLARMFVEDMVFDGTRAYLCGDDVVIVDLARPTSPVIAGRLTEVEGRAIATDGELVYVVGRHGLLVAKPPTTRRPTPLMVVNAQGDAFRTALQPPIAFVAGGFRGLWVIDMERTPGVVGRLDFYGWVFDVACDSTYAFLAAGSNGLAVAEGRLDVPPRLVSQLQLPSESRAIVLEDTLAYLAQADLGLWIVDVSDPLTPRLLGSVDTAMAFDLVIRDGRAWIADFGFGLVAADVTDPEHPRIVAGVETESASVRALALDGDYAYLVSEDGRLQLIDISNPGAPKFAGHLEFPSVMRDVAIDGHFAYLATEMGLMVADVSDPMAPTFVGMACEGVAAGVMVDGATNRIFVANGNLTVIRPQCDDQSRGVSP